MGGEPVLHVGVEGAARLQGAVAGEDDVGRGGGELPALGRVTGLDDDGVALRGAGQPEPALDAEVLPGVGDGLPGAVRGGGVPQFTGGGDELGGAGVAVGPVEEAAAPEVLPGERVEGGDDVPGGAAGAEVVQGGEAAGQFVGLVEGGVDGGGEAEPFGGGGERGEDGQRLGAADHVEVVDAPLVLAQPQPLGEEEEVEEAAFGGSGQVGEGGEGDLPPAGSGRRGRGLGVLGPDGGVVDAREVGGEVHRPAGHAGSPWVVADRSAPRAAAYRLAGRARPRWSRRVAPG